MNEIFWGKALEKKGIAIKICVKAYRYGFNGKEKDDQGEWGSTNYDYGFRIYSPVIARFLSVDPLTKSYPMLTPYQFASNRPIDGIDLDGLEYLKADEARVQIVLGTAFIKLENFSKLYQTQFRKENPGFGLVYQNADGTGYGAGEIGTIFVPVLDKRKDARLSNKTNDPTYDPTALELKPANRRSRRFNERKGAPVIATGKVPRGAGGAVLILNTINFAAEAYAQSIISNDVIELAHQTKDWKYVVNNWPFEDMVNENISPLTRALEDVQTAIREGIIDQEFQNIRSLSDITNIVLFGGSGHETEEIIEIGNRIIKEISEKREEKINTDKKNK